VENQCISAYFITATVTRRGPRETTRLHRCRVRGWSLAHQRAGALKQDGQPQETEEIEIETELCC